MLDIPSFFFFSWNLVSLIFEVDDFFTMRADEVLEAISETLLKTEVCIGLKELPTSWNLQRKFSLWTCHVPYEAIILEVGGRVSLTAQLLLES